MDAEIGAPRPSSKPPIYVDPSNDCLCVKDPVSGQLHWIFDAESGEPMKRQQLFLDSASGNLCAVNQAGDGYVWLIDPITGNPIVGELQPVQPPVAQEEPEPAPAPTHEPEAELAPAPEAAPEPEPEAASAPVTEPMLEPAPDPAPEPALEVVSEPAIALASEPAPLPVQDEFAYGQPQEQAPVTAAAGSAAVEAAPAAVELDFEPDEPNLPLNGQVAPQGFPQGQELEMRVEQLYELIGMQGRQIQQLQHEIVRSKGLEASSAGLAASLPVVVPAAESVAPTATEPAVPTAAPAEAPTPVPTVSPTATSAPAPDAAAAPSPSESAPTPASQPEATGDEPAAKRRRGTSGMAIASLILGIVAAATVFLPFSNIAPFLYAAIGIVLAIGGLIVTGKNKLRGRAVAVLGLLACIGTIVLINVLEANFWNILIQTITSLPQR